VPRMVVIEEFSSGRNQEEANCVGGFGPRVLKPPSKLSVLLANTNVLAKN